MWSVHGMPQYAYEGQRKALELVFTFYLYQFWVLTSQGCQASRASTFPVEPSCSPCPDPTTTTTQTASLYPNLSLILPCLLFFC